jgi:hypothetical protein
MIEELTFERGMILKNKFALTTVLFAAVTASGIHLLTAQEIPGLGARATPRQIKEMFASSRPTLATTARSSVNTTQDLRSLADDLDIAGLHVESVRLK